MWQELCPKQIKNTSYTSLCYPENVLFFSLSHLTFSTAGVFAQLELLHTVFRTDTAFQRPSLATSTCE